MFNNSSNAISNIVLCNVTITPMNQIDFTSKTEQFNYFASKAVIPNTDKTFSYQARSSIVSVKGYVDELQNVNYGYYTNTYNGVSKIFYFWIVDKAYKARETTHLTIQLDVFQTWMFDYSFAPCMIERQHVVNDIIGVNTFPESFELGDYVTLTKHSVDVLQGNPCFFIGVTDTQSQIGGIFGKTYSGFCLKYYSYSGIGELTTYIKNLDENGKADAIAFIFTFPQKLVQQYIPSTLSDGDIISGIEGACNSLVNFNWDDMQHKFIAPNGDEYTPYNNKLFCYPFNMITIKNPSGGNVVLKMELFQDLNNIQFEIDGVVTQNPIITCTPRNYSNKTFAIDDSISMQEYGLCSWNNDNYSNWYAQHVNTINAQSTNARASFVANQDVNGNNFFNALDNRDTQAKKGIVNTGVSVANAIGSLNFVGGVTSGFGGAMNTLLDYDQNTKNAQNDLDNRALLNYTDYQNTIRSVLASVSDAQVQPNTCKGSTASCGLDLARDTATFIIEQVGIKPEYARMIDFYFQMFGYKVNTIAIPNLHTRNKWNYIKTVNCQTYGNVPSKDLEEINSLFNNGLTIWHQETYMYQYDTINEIL